MAKTLTSYQLEILIGSETQTVQIEARSSDSAINRAWKQYKEATSIKLINFEPVGLDVILRRNGAPTLPGFEKFGLEKVVESNGD